MKKKVLSVLLAAVMCSGTAGNAVWAASEDFELEIQAETDLTDETDESDETEISVHSDDPESDFNDAGEVALFDDGSDEEDSEDGDSEDGDSDLTDISDYEVELEEGPYLYDGEDVEPEVLSVYPKGNSDEELIEDTDYEVSYEDNDMPGTAYVIVSGVGDYEGEIRKDFVIDKGEQDLELEDISLKEGEEAELDLSTLTGDITLTPSMEGYVEITESEGEDTDLDDGADTDAGEDPDEGENPDGGEDPDEDTDTAGHYIIKALKAGKITLKIQAAGDEYYNSFKTEVNVFIAKAEHHHSYLLPDASGAYTKYDESKAVIVPATCQAAGYTLYRCTDEDCGYEEKIPDADGTLADHTWGDHQASEEDPPTYADAGTLVHVCKVCGEEEEIEEKDWAPEDYKLIQKLKNDQGSISVGESKMLELTTYNDDEYGQYLSFTPEEKEAYQIKLKVLDGDEIESCFTLDDVNLTQLSNAETLEAEKTYYICIQGTGKCEVSIEKVQRPIDISDYEVIWDFDPDVPFVADGSPIEPDIQEIVAKYDDEEITYNVSYEDNEKPGTGKIIITGSGRYMGTITKEFKIIAGTQELEQEDVSLKVGENTKLDFSSLVGEITLIPSEENLAEITGPEDGYYTVEAKAAGIFTLAIRAAGNDYFDPFEGSITISISKPEHHHTYLSQDASGEYTVYKPANGKDIVYHEATCTVPYYIVYKCTDEECGFSETITDPKGSLKAHNFKEEVIPPTCTSEGYTKLVCNVCGYTTVKDNSQVDTLEHDFRYVDTIEATEDSRAYHLYRCTACGIQKREYFGCIKNQHTFEERVIPPTCTKDGYTKKTCTVCGYSETGNEVSALGHDMKDTAYEPTETSYGYTRSECTRCGYHVDTITSCKIRLDENGNKVSVHEGVAVPDSESQPDCTKPGTMKYKCKICKKTYDVEIPDKLPAKEHTWVVNAGDEATCEEEGLKTCSVCDATEVIPALGHQMVKDTENSQEASYAEKGVEILKCSNLGCDKTQETYTQRKHVDGSFALSVGSRNVTVKESSLPEGADGVYYRFKPTETKVYYVNGGENLDTTFCKNDYDLTDLSDTAPLNAGETYYVCISGDGSGKVTISNVTNFTNIQKEKYQIVIMDDPNTLVYSGDEVEPSSIMIKMQNNSMMDIPDDWKVEYSNNVNAGTATIAVTGGGRYNGTITSKFTIKKAPQEIEETSFSLNVNDSLDLDWEFFGNEIEVTSDNDSVLRVLKTDGGYKIVGMAAGSANLKVHVSGNANYESLDAAIPVVVAQKGHVHGFANADGDLDTAKIITLIDEYKENPENNTDSSAGFRIAEKSRNCETGVVYDVTCLKDGCDQYTVQYLDEREVGEHTYDEGKVILKPTYETLGKLERTCTKCGDKTTEDIDQLERTDLEDFDVELSRYAYVYDGKEKKPSVKLYDENGKVLSNKLYKVTYKNNKNPGDNTASVVITPTSNDYCGSVTVTFTIAQAKLSMAGVPVGGKAKLTLIGISSIDDFSISKGKFISWNKKTGIITGNKLGKAKLTINGYDKEDNDVTISVTISVVPKATALSKVKSKAKKQAVVSWKANKTGGGYQIQYSTDKNFKKGVKTLKVTSSKTKSATIKSLKSKKTYYFRIRTINNKSASLVSGWSKVKQVKIK